MMASPWNLKRSRRLQFDGRPLWILLIVAPLIAMAWTGPEVIKSIILTSRSSAFSSSVTGRSGD